jgi:hypothetical protein
MYDAVRMNFEPSATNQQPNLTCLFLSFDDERTHPLAYSFPVCVTAHAIDSGTEHHLQLPFLPSGVRLRLSVLSFCSVAQMNPCFNHAFRPSFYEPHTLSAF